VSLIKLWTSPKKPRPVSKTPRLALKIQDCLKKFMGGTIFLKELNVLGMKFQNKRVNPDPDKAKLEELS
jgi:hypothetical protein